MVKSDSVFKRFVLALGTVAIALGALTGCSVEKKADELSDKLVDVLVKNEVVVDDFALIGTDVIKNGFDFDVNFNGVASKNNTQALASLNYVIPASEFHDLTKTSSSKDLYIVLNHIVDNYEMKDYSFSYVENLVDFNNTMVKNMPPAFDGYKTDDALVYNLSKPKFNEENHTASFDIKMIGNFVKERKNKIEPGFGIGFSNSGIGLGYGMFFNIKEKEGTFTIVDKYTVSLSEEEFEQVKQNPDWVYDLCADAIQHKDKTQIKAERLNVNMVTYDSADLSHCFDMEDTVNEMN